MIKLAALWKKESKNTNRPFYSGKLGDAVLLLFRNDKKQNETHPDLILYVEENRNGKERTAAREEEDIPF